MPYWPFFEALVLAVFMAGIPLDSHLPSVPYTLFDPNSPYTVSRKQKLFTYIETAGCAVAELESGSPIILPATAGVVRMKKEKAYGIRKQS